MRLFFLIFSSFMMSILTTTDFPTAFPTLAPSETVQPTLVPSVEPTFAPTYAPSVEPTLAPSVEPSVEPTFAPSAPTVEPTFAPSAPTVEPTLAPSVEPSVEPTLAPSVEPTLEPTIAPSAPTVEPTFAPSVEPTLEPTFAPSEQPTLEPTIAPSAPTVEPTFAPSVEPTFAPSVEPTAFPTSFPTTIPTGIPTSNPTQLLCDVNILLFDLYGDGWSNAQLVVEIDGESSNYTLKCGHCERINFIGHCNISIYITTTDGKEPYTPWENYWVVAIDGETFIGGVDSTLNVDLKTITGTNLIDYNETIKCDECTHPKPKPSPGKGGKGSKGGKGKKGGKDDDKRKLSKSPKRPPSFANAKLYDQQKNGWFNSKGWNDVCDSDECAPGDTNCTLSLPNIPNALIYPRYYILNENKTEIIHEGTICSNSRGFELCENSIPHNGDFVFRVAGIEPEDDVATWEFCGKSGGINEELQFSMKDGTCVPGVHVTAEQYCGGLNSSVVLVGTIIFNGVKSESLTAVDTNVLETDIGLMIPSSSIAIKSWTHSDDGLKVHFSATFLSDSELLYYHNNVDDLVAKVSNSLSTSISSGVFQEQLSLGLSSAGNSKNDVLRSSSSITLEDVSIYSLAYIPFSKDGSHSSPIEIVTSPIDSTVTKSSSQGTIYTFSTIGVYALVTVGIILLGVVAVVVKSNMKRTHELLPTDSSHVDGSSA